MPACPAEDRSDKGTLRPAKSMDSLSASAGASDGEQGRAPASALTCLQRGPVSVRVEPRL